MRATRELLDYETTNALVAWAVVGVLLLVAAERAASSDLLWAGIAVVTAAVALVPPAVARDPREMAAWEILALAAAPVVAPYAGLLEGHAAYVSVATLALLGAVELDAFTSVEMTGDFAVAFVVLVTMAVTGVWVVASYVSDTYLGTTVLTDQTALMWDVIAATGVGVAAGIVFELYVRRLSPGHGIRRELSGDG